MDLVEPGSYHDSESEDIYDLYNACNGAMHDGYLDVRKLDELSADEIEALDINRLKEIWIHTTHGCQICASIITTLNRVRKLV